MNTRCDACTALLLKTADVEPHEALKLESFERKWRRADERFTCERCGSKWRREIAPRERARMGLWALREA